MRRACLAGILVVLTSCTAATAPAPVHDLDAIQVNVRVDPATVVSGATTNVILTLKNTAPRPSVISACPIYFWVEGSAAEVVGGSKVVFCLAGSLVYQPLEFKPLETKTFTITWLVGETVAVPAGSYDVYGWVNLPEHRSAPARLTVN